MKEKIGKTIKTSNGDMAPYFFHQGTSCRAFDYLGAHPTADGAFVFRVWAPNADAVSLVGDFNGWDTGSHPMDRVTEKGVWEIFVKDSRLQIGQHYKYFLTNGEKRLYKADPYGFSMQRPPETATVLCDLSGYSWGDGDWMARRRARFDRENAGKQPINIYEVHLGSFQRDENGAFLSYPELAESLAVYAKQMGYTHIELMPIAEHPFDGSWGYQICGYYAPTKRFGEPQEFMRFVDILHRAGVGVILDWVPAHFPKDEHGLYEFDGQPLYECQGLDRMEQESWGTRRFDVGREEVQSFLVSNAVFWADRYHIDGLRVDAVASMLYLDYDKRPGEWIPNVYGGNQSLEAVAFFQKLNSCMAKDHPDVMMIAEESTAFAHITDFSDGGLGFTFKWNMGWMNDALSYAAEDPLWRCDHHNQLTFSLTYAFGERYLLPISHDEVVHGKRSLLDRMPGDYDTKFAGCRTFLTYMMTHPGKKLLFMGSEFGQFREWDYRSSLEWFLLDFEKHEKLQFFVSRLNQFYLSSPQLWQADESPDSFCWIDADNRAESIFSYRRIDGEGRELIVLLNFLPLAREDFLLAVPKEGLYEEVFNTDEEAFGGSGMRNSGLLPTEPCQLRDYRRAIRIRIPAMSGLIFRYNSQRKEKNDFTLSKE